MNAWTPRNNLDAGKVALALRARHEGAGGYPFVAQHDRQHGWVREVGRIFVIMLIFGAVSLSFYLLGWR